MAAEDVAVVVLGVDVDDDVEGVVEEDAEVVVVSPTKIFPFSQGFNMLSHLTLPFVRTASMRIGMRFLMICCASCTGILRWERNTWIASCSLAPGVRCTQNGIMASKVLIP